LQRKPVVAQSFRLRRHFLPFCCALCFALFPTFAAAQNTTPGEKPDAAVQTQMRNVLYRLTDNVAVHIKWMTGAVVPTGDNEFPVLDDKNSFVIRIDAAEIEISPSDLANLLNSYVFARPHAPVTGITTSVENGQLKLKGKLHDKGDIPFETVGVLSATPDGKVRLHSEKIKALHVPVKGLMDIFGVQVADLIKSGKALGVQTEGNDLILDVEQMLPPPHIEGKVTTVRTEGNTILQTFGGPEAKAPKKLQSGNYISFQGNRIRAGKITLTDTDVRVIDMDPGDPLEFYMDHYVEQWAAGYTKIGPNFSIRIYSKDFGKLAKSNASSGRDDTRPKENSAERNRRLTVS
jgi:hypothetical protein